MIYFFSSSLPPPLSRLKETMFYLSLIGIYHVYNFFFWFFTKIIKFFSFSHYFKWFSTSLIRSLKKRALMTFIENTNGLGAESLTKKYSVMNFVLICSKSQVKAGKEFPYDLHFFKFQSLTRGLRWHHHVRDADYRERFIQNTKALSSKGPKKANRP